MPRSLLLVPLLLLLAGCGGGFFQVSPEEYRAKIKTLGVLPLLVDETSTLKNPEPQELLALLRRTNVGKEQRLVELLRQRGDYFDVRAVAADPAALAPRLLVGKALVTEDGAVFRHYRVDPALVAELCRSNAVDGLLIVVLNGVERMEKRWDRLHFNYLEAMYNNIQATALVVTPDGQAVWEYPGSGPDPFLVLQYADFDEAFYNKTEAVKIRFISLGGLERTLTEPDRSVFGQSDFPRLYREWAERLSGALSPGLSALLPGRKAAPAQ